MVCPIEPNLRLMEMYTSHESFSDTRSIGGEGGLDSVYSGELLDGILLALDTGYPVAA